MPQFASGRYALGICDRCGFECDYTELRPQTLSGQLGNGQRSQIYVCRSCRDVPQPKQRKVPQDAMALRHPRPDGSLEASRRILHWKPTDSCLLLLRLGNVTTENLLPDPMTLNALVLGLGSVEVESDG